MPIASFNPESPPPSVPETPKTEPASFKGVVVNDNQTPLKSLVTYMEGAPWTVNYYGQVLGRDNDLRNLDANQSPIYQQYNKIVGLEIRVTAGLSMSGTDSETALTSVGGSAVVYPFMTPNVGDIFVAAAGDGRQGLFRLTNVERKTFNRMAVFAIDYELATYVDADTSRIQDLEEKVIRTYFFDKDRLIEDNHPLLQETEHHQMRDLSALYKSMCQFYFKTFFNKEFSTLILPGQTVTIYDSFLVNYLLKIVDTFDAYEIRYVKDLSTNGEPFMQQDQFWKIMMERDHGLLKFCNKDMGLVSCKAFEIHPMLHNLRYTRIQYVIYPKDGDHSIFSGSHDPIVKVQSLTELVTAPSQSGNLANILHNNLIEQNVTIPYIEPVLKDTSYVLSDAFYNDGQQKSVLEILVTDYLKGNAINIERLWKLCQQYRNWGRLEQFYYLPILMTLIKTSVKGLY